ncbi:MAG: RNA polymerase sigma-70 factor [Prevotella sp.]|nr:RNA polymerase sigma-70 factor [Prevotella sp.]
MDFDKLYTQLFPRLVQVASAWMASEEAEDLVQDVLVKLWEQRERLSFVNNIETYAFAAVRHKYLDYLKHKTYVREHQHSVWANMRLACDLESPTRDVEYRELCNRVEWAVGQLPKRSRAVFVLSRFEDKTNAEIAIEMGISVNTVECHMTQALRRMNYYLRVS